MRAGRRSTMILLLVGAVAGLAGCGGGSGGSADGPSGVSDSVTVEAAVASPGTSLTVHGWIVPRFGLLRLCTSRGESEPPTCGDPSLVLDGFAGTISAIEEAVLVGTVKDDRLIVDMSASIAKNTNE
jgi:hypothetical protein